MATAELSFALTQMAVASRSSCVTARLARVSSTVRTQSDAVASLGGLRTYYPRPVPAVDRDDVQRFLLRGVPAVSKIPARDPERAKPSVTLSYKLNESERILQNQAEKRGYLEILHSSTEGLVNHYFKTCVDWRRPYVALHRDGGSLEVDLTPMLGTIRNGDVLATAEKQKAAVLEQLKAVLAGEIDVQVLNKGTLKEQAIKILPGSKEGSNAAKLKDTTVGDVCTVYVKSRNQAKRVAEAFHRGYLHVAGLPKPEERVVLEAQKAIARREKYTLRMVRNLRKLVADPLAVKNLRVAAGAVDGFVAADKSGEAHLQALRMARKHKTVVNWKNVITKYTAKPEEDAATPAAAEAPKQ